MKTTIGNIKEIWRYPIKSVGGEELDAVYVDENGIWGDRIFAFKENKTDLIVSAKHPKKWGKLIECKASYANNKLSFTLRNDAKKILTNNEIEAAVRSLCAHEVSLVKQSRINETREADRSPLGELGTVINKETLATASKEGHFFDYAPLHIITTATIKQFEKLYPQGNFNVKRFRPNIVIDTKDQIGFIENDWIGKTICIGNKLNIKIIEPCPRCVMTTIEQGSIQKDLNILRTIVGYNTFSSSIEGEKRQFSGVLGVYGKVVKNAELSLEDEVVFL